MRKIDVWRSENFDSPTLEAVAQGCSVKKLWHFKDEESKCFVEQTYKLLKANREANLVIQLI